MIRSVLYIIAFVVINWSLVTSVYAAPDYVGERSQEIAESSGGLVQTSSLPLLEEGYRDDTFSGPLFAESVSPRSCGLVDDRVEIRRLRVVTGMDHDRDGFDTRFELELELEAPAALDTVFVKLYLSYEGGPWNLVHRSGVFYIDPWDARPQIGLEVWLDRGYPSGYYDARLEVFDAASGRWLISIGPYDFSSLSSLALEDRERDDISVSSDYDVQYGLNRSGGGVASPFFVLLSLLLSRQSSIRRCQRSRY